MNVNKLLGGLALSTILCAGLSSCSNDMNEPTLDQVKANMLVKAPKVIAYSGDHIWGQDFTRSLGTRAGENVVTSTPVKDTFNEKDVADLTNKTNEFLEEGNSNNDKLDTDFLYYADQDITFTLYCLLKNTNQNHYLGVFYYDENGVRHEEIVWQTVNPNLGDKTYDWDPEANVTVVHQNLEGVQISIKAGYKFGFYWNGVCRPHEGNYTDEECVYYSIAELNEPQQDYDSDEVLSTHAGTFEIDGKTIIGLEDWYDFDYQDLVFFTDQTLKKVPSTDLQPNPGEPTTPEGCPNDVCDHNKDKHNPDRTCRECGPDEGCNKKDEPNKPEGPDVKIPDVVDPGFTVTPDEKPAEGIQEEVEVNLGVDDKDKQLQSHLSIHVRTATNVDVFIPVPEQYYCDTDDMEIVMKHEPNHMGHGGPFQYTYTLKDSDPELFVTLNLEFLPDGIHIWTEGINQAVIDWCQEKCQDGITFEIWNYFNDTIDLEGLKEYLDQTTIKFLDKLPEYFINSFGEANFAEDKDCTVSIVDEQAGNYEYQGKGEYQNGSDKNDIFKKNEDNVRPTPPPVPVY